MGQRLRIGIVGAGIGGLAAAALLAQDQHDVTLLERFAAPRPIGSGLVVQPVGLAVLDALGAGQAARAFGAPIRSMKGQSGQRLALDVAYRDTAPGLAMHRASLFEALWQATLRAGVRVLTNCAVQSAPLMGAARTIIAADQSQGPFDLVIDASGAGSMLSPLKARPLPFGAIWGQVPWPAESALPADRLSQRYHRASRMAGVLPIGTLPGDPTPRAAVFWSLPRAALDGWADCDLAGWQAEVVAFWPAMAPFVGQLTETGQMTPARYSHGTLRQPFAPALAYLGDAAHRASPQLGQGANMALLDAFALCHALRNHPLDEALPQFAAHRRLHQRSYQVMSAVFTPMYQSESRALPWLRDRVMAPAARVWPMPRLLTALVSGDLIPPLASVRWPG